MLMALSAPLAHAQTLPPQTAAPAEPKPAAETDQAAQLLLAETLYREGRRLAAEQRYDEAIAKLSESYRIDPGVGTLLALAVCHEAQGRLATAWVEFGDAMRAAQRDKRDDRVQLARDHLAQIEPKLSRLTIALAPQESLAELDVRLDGVRIGAAAQGVAVPIDPGQHRVDATAPGRVPFSHTFTIGPSADQRVVVVPSLREPPPTPPPPPQSVLVPKPPPPPVRYRRPIPDSVYIAGVTGLALLGAAVGTGIAYSEGADACHRDNTTCDSARRVGWVNLGVSAAAAVAGGAMIYFYVTRPSQPVSGGLSIGYQRAF
ncbi:MAG: hypothetical protein QM756_01685 [Polyangiaceae bacterium]